MASTNVKTITDTNFSDEVLKSELPTLVDFWAVWCGPCKQIAPTIDALADEYKGKLAVGKVDVDREQIVAPSRSRCRWCSTCRSWRCRPDRTRCTWRGGGAWGRGRPPTR
jgi:hypothetical protein